jgi:hypothetical protein
MTMRVRTILLLSLAPLLLACGDGPSVLQGTVVGYDSQAKVVTVKDERAPGATTEISVAGAEIGAEPAPGDTVRIAYRVTGGRPVASRVMNITRQTEVGKGAKTSGGH